MPCNTAKKIFPFTCAAVWRWLIWCYIGNVIIFIVTLLREVRANVSGSCVCLQFADTTSPNPPLIICIFWFAKLVVSVVTHYCFHYYHTHYYHYHLVRWWNVRGPSLCLKLYIRTANQTINIFEITFKCLKSFICVSTETMFPQIPVLTVHSSWTVHIFLFCLPSSSCNLLVSVESCILFHKSPSHACLAM